MHQGDFGKVGSIIVWNYVHDGKHCVAKEVIEAVDPAKNLISFRVIKGDVLQNYKSFKATLQVIQRQKEVWLTGLFTSHTMFPMFLLASRIKHAIIEGSWGKVSSVITWHYVHEGKNCVAKEFQAIPKDEESLVHVTTEYGKLKGHIPDTHTLIDLVAEVASDVDAHIVTQ
ncbi:hypothetical protein K1719_003808 [Acacia pycnantha]|nr:hypothetical protein K1719_003808 [Acacia pycnantha]